MNRSLVSASILALIVSVPALAQTKISALPAAPSPAASDYVPCVSGSTTYRCTSSQIASFAASATGVTSAALTQALSARNGLKAGNAIVAYSGDSICAGYLAGRSANADLIVGANVTLNTTNCVSGSTLTAALASEQNSSTYSALYSSSKPLIVILQRGTNDIRGNDGNYYTGAQLYSTASTFISLLKQRGAYVGLCTILPFTNGTSTAIEQARQDYNAKVRANTAGADFIVDVAASPLMGEAVASVASDTTKYVDGLHPTGLGQDYLTPTYEAALQLPVSFAVRAAQTALAISAAAPAGTVGTAYSFTPTISGGTSPYTVTLASGALPAGLSLASGTGAVTGTPTTAATYTFVEKVTDSASTPATANSASQSVTIAASGSSNPGYASSANSANDLTFNSTPAFAAAKFGQGLAGASGVYASVPTSLVPASGLSGAFTIEAWFSTTQTGLGVIFGQTSGGGPGYYVGANGGQLQTADISASGPIINDGAQHHTVYEVLAASTRLYVDGVLVGTGTARPSISGALTVKNYLGGQYALNGTVDEVQITSSTKYTGASYTVPTAAYTGSEVNTVGLWHLEGNGYAAH